MLKEKKRYLISKFVINQPSLCLHPLNKTDDSTAILSSSPTKFTAITKEQNDLI